MGAVESILVALSLCADCFAVSICSSVTIKKIGWSTILKVGLVFAVIQSGLLLIGWAFGGLFVGLVDKISHIIGFLLLLYVGGGMFLEGIKNKCDVRNLNGLKNVVLGGVATSIDALAVGVAQSMEDSSWRAMLPLLISVFVITLLSVISGILGGKKLGCHFGRWAEIAGGVVLIGIGVGVLI